MRASRLFLMLSIALPFFALLPAEVVAQKYSVSVTRKEQNFYEVTASRLFIETRYCYAYVYFEDSLLDVGAAKIHFLGSKDSCDVAAYYRSATIKPGKYAVTVSRKDDNLYEIFGANIILRTAICLELALGEDAVLNWSAPGFGRLYFPNSKTDCMVESALTRRATP